MKKSQNVLREALTPVFATLVAIAVVLTGVYFSASSTTTADRGSDLSEYVSANWEEAERIDQSQFVSHDVLEAIALELNIGVDEVTMFVRNSNGQIVGTEAYATCREQVPDLIAVSILEGQTGTIFGRTPEGWIDGFVFAKDFYCEETTSAYQAVANSIENTIRLTEEIAQRGQRSIPVYDIEGEVILGMLEVGYNTWPGT